ncbi:hypothetical protein J6590_020619 [Homalodisca vitripennis]|nr:hypothetical protein J6590_020619 [Homalodisca vitripennis]
MAVLRQNHLSVSNTTELSGWQENNHETNRETVYQGYLDCSGMNEFLLECSSKRFDSITESRIRKCELPGLQWQEIVASEMQFTAISFNNRVQSTVHPNHLAGSDTTAWVAGMPPPVTCNGHHSCLCPQKHKWDYHNFSITLRPRPFQSEGSIGSKVNKKLSGGWLLEDKCTDSGVAGCWETSVPIVEYDIASSRYSEGSIGSKLKQEALRWLATERQAYRSWSMK